MKHHFENSFYQKLNLTDIFSANVMKGKLEDENSHRLKGGFPQY